MSTSAYPEPTTDLAVLQQQKEYQKLRKNVAIGMLFVCPALMLLPPRKLDFYTFGLGFAWVFCANEVAKQSTGGVDLMTLIATKGDAVKGKELERKAQGWLGEEVVRREQVDAGLLKKKQEESVDEDERGIGQQIVDAVWDVWQQRGKQGGISEEEEERMSELSLRERVEQKRRELAEKKAGH